MSKHYELMQQIEKDRKLAAAAGPAVAEQNGNGVHAVVAEHNGNGSHAPALELSGNGASQWASEEALRLVQQVFLQQVAEPPRVVVFAGVDHGNGCSHICAAVAETLATNEGGRVCLVEANFRSPALPAMFGVANHFGLTEALLRDAPIRSFAKPVYKDRLWLLSSGTLTVDSPNLLTSDNLRSRIAEMRKQFDCVIIDAPPLNPYSDAVALGQLSDGLVLVIEADSTRREAASAATETLRSAKVPILAAVLNKRTFPIPEKIYSLL
jgi:receptor protein-tyrosine kinase